MRAVRSVMLCFGLSLLAACSFQQQNKPEETGEDELRDPNKPRMGFEDPSLPGMNPLLTGGAVDPNAQSYNVTTSEELAQIDNGAEGEVYFTDPDNPDADIEGITNAFEMQRSGNVWLGHYGRATRTAHRECRPLIIWFHDSVIAPDSASLGEALLDTPEFDEWCRDRVVRVKLDTGADLAEHKPGTTVRYGREAIDRLARRYGLKRKPALAVISPQGKFVMGIDGYDSTAAQIEGLLKEGVILAEKEILEYQKKLEPKGYRTWTSATGEVSVFARIQRYNPEKQMLYLKEYGGRIQSLKLHRLCKEDQEIVLKEQAARQERKEKKRRRKRS